MLKNGSEEQVQDGLRYWRKLNGLTQKEVEAVLGLRALSIHDYEKGRLKLPMDVAIQLARLYQTDLNQLVNFEAEKKNLSVPFQLLGLQNNQMDHFSKLVFADPIMLGISGRVEQDFGENCFLKILDMIPKRNHEEFFVELLCYLNSLIAADKKILNKELSFCSEILKGFSFKVSGPQRKAIQDALEQQYFGQNLEVFKQRTVKHFFIWLLILAAVVDGKLDYREMDYIKKVASHIRLPVKNQKFIFDLVREWQKGG